MPGLPLQQSEDAGTRAAAASRPRVFISYARSDGEALARELRRRLVLGPPALSVWQDRAELEGGVGWWKQITDALEQVEFLVLVMTPAALRSEMVQREWRYARQQGVCVYPVFDTALALDFSVLPRWMRKAHFFDLGREWDTLVAHLARPAVVKRIPFMAPDLVRGFVARPEVLQPLRSALLGSTGASVGITTALQGAGGLGKTTLAVALCHDEDVIEAFDDGIVWATLGNEPKLLDELAKVYVALTGRRPGFVDEEDAAYHLGQALEERNCLIVIDDVWHAAHLKPFLRGGRGCVRLFTTRLADIAPDATRYAVDAMSLAQAAELLRKGLHPDQHEALSLRRLAARLGEWPLLLELANAQLRRRVDRGDTLTGAIAYAEQRLEREGVVAFDLRRAEQRQEAVARTMQLSLDLLAVQEVEAFSRLAVFAEDADIPLGVAAALWQRDGFEAEDLAQLLDDISLARFSLRTGTLRLHDLVRAYAATLVADLPGLHRELAARLAAPDPAVLDYAWRWRPWHLVHGGETQALRALLEDPQWLLAKLKHTEVVALGEDLDLVEDDLLRLVQQAIRLAGAALARHGAELPGQLLARLPSDPAAPRLQAFRSRCAETRSVTWLRPLRALLTPAGSANVASLLGHDAPVLALALSGDGTLLASGAADGSIRLWDWRRGKPLAVPAGHDARVVALAFSTDADVLASAAEDGTLRLWDGQAGTARGALRLGNGHPRQIFPSPVQVGRWWVLATGGLWDVAFDAPGAQRCLIDGGPGIDDLAMGAGGLMVGAVGGRVMRLWSVEPAQVRGHDERRLPHVASVAVAPQAALAFGIGRDGALTGWPIVRTEGEARSAGFGEAVHRLPGWFDVARLATDPRGQWVAAAGRAWTVEVVPVAASGTVQTLTGHRGPVNDVRLTPDASHAFSASDDGSIRVWDLRRPVVARPAPAHVQAVRSLALSADARFAFSTADGHELVVWDVAASEPCGSATGSGAWQVDAPDGSRWALWLLAERRLVCRPVAKGEEPVVWDIDALHGRQLRAQQSALAGEARLVIEADRSLMVWSGDPLRCDLVLPSSGDFANDLAFSADDAHLAMLGSDGQLVQWRLAPLNEVHRCTVPRGSVALSARGERMAFAPAQGGVRVIQPAGGQHALPLAAVVRDLAFTRGAALLLCACDDGALRLLEPQTGTLVASFTSEVAFTCCAAAVDGSYLVAGDEAGQVHFFALHAAQDA